jgi:chlorite dismutase
MQNPTSNSLALPNPRLFHFIGGDEGDLTVLSMRVIAGEAFESVSRIDIVPGSSLQESIASSQTKAKWILSGVTSNERYATRDEKNQLVAKQAALGRTQSTLMAMLPIKKNAAWWAMTQDERRAIFEERSHHTAIGLKYLPNIARRLHHCRDLEFTSPFDFITLFDFAPSDASAFDDLLFALRETEEWKYVEREVDIRIVCE